MEEVLPFQIHEAGAPVETFLIFQERLFWFRENGEKSTIKLGFGLTSALQTSIRLKYGLEGDQKAILSSLDRRDSSIRNP